MRGTSSLVLRVIHEMDWQGMKLQLATYIAVIGACSSSSSAASSIHRRILANGKLDVLDAARMVFHRILHKDVFAWTVMVEIYAESGIERESASLFREMLLEGVKPSEVTFIAVLEACSQLATVKTINSQVDEAGLDKRIKVATSLVDSYGKCGSLDQATRIFERMVQKDTVAWNAVMKSYSRNKIQGDEALRLFRRMHLEGVDPDSVTFIAALEACSSLQQVTFIHSCIRSCGLESEVTVANALVSAYAKFGRSESARLVFDSLVRKDLVSWSAVIAAYAQSGQEAQALGLFQDMTLDGMPPSETIFLVALFSSSHAGMVERSSQLLNAMIADWNLAPRLDHYACIVDVLARSGFLSSAEDLIETMPFAPLGVQWMALLGWCKLHSDPERAARAAQKLFELEPDKSSPYALLSSSYTGFLSGVLV